MHTIRSFCLSLGAALGFLTSPVAAQWGTIRLEIDYMVDDFHSHQPTQAELDAVIQMFACKGITLIIDLDDALPHADIVQCQTAGDGYFFSCTNYEYSFGTLEDEYRDQGAGWHYCIFGHRYNDGDGTGSSGLGEILGDEFFVADGTFSSSSSRPFRRASTLAHELGHNLGLRHHSSGSTSDADYAPNLPSIMSYRYQLQGVKQTMEASDLVGNDHLFKNLDFSDGRMPTVNEAMLVESRGLGMVPIDWNCSGGIFGTAQQVLDLQTDWCPFDFGTDTLADRDEWATILDVAYRGSAWDDSPRPYETCAPVPTDAEDSLFGGPPALIFEPCVSGEMIFFDPGSTAPSENGTGARPFRTLDALTTAPPGSIAYLQAGTHTLSSGGSLVLDSRIVLAGPGVAVLEP